MSYIELAEKQTSGSRAAVPGHQPGAVLLRGPAQPNPINVQKVDTLDWLSADSDGDGIRDDQDDVDHDDVPNITEYLQEIAAPFKDRKYRQLDACVPNSDSRFCLLGSADVDGDGIPNRDDTDDDGDGLPDTLEQQLGSTRCAPTPTATASRTATSTGPRSTSTAPHVPSRARRPTPTRSTAPTPTSTSTATASPSRRSTRPGTTPAGRSR